MVFSKHLLDGIRRGRIKCSIRSWMHPHVKVKGRYPLGDGHIVVDSITPLDISEVTPDLVRESGFASVQDLLDLARHGKGDNIYLIRFHYLRPGEWVDESTAAENAPEGTRGPTLLQRIRTTVAPQLSRRKGRGKPGGGGTPRGDR